MKSRSLADALTKKIIFAMAVLVLGGILGIILFSGRIVKEALQRTSRSALESLLSDVDKSVSAVQNIEAFATYQLSPSASSSTNLADVCNNLLLLNDQLSAVAVAFTADGSPIKGSLYGVCSFRDTLSSSPDTLSFANYADADWFTNPLRLSSAVWGEPAPSPFGPGNAIPYSAPLFDDKGKVFAVFVAFLDLDKLASNFVDNTYFDGAHPVVFSNKGSILVHPDASLVLTNLSDMASKSDDFKPLANKLLSDKASSVHIRSLSSVAVLSPVSNGWYAALVCPDSTLLLPVFRFQLILLLAGLFDLLVLYIISRWLIKRTLLPITEVTYFAKNVAKGNFNVVVPHVDGNDEMHHLYEAINNMLLSINDYITQLRSTTAANLRFENELTIASNIQQQMLRTDFINDHEVDLFAKLTPAKEVGGDMYDFLRVGRTIYFAVGDVSGKGVPAALYMAISRSLFHYVSELSMSTSSIVSCINSSFCSGNDSNMFITMFVGRLDLDTREMVFCNAGHNPIVLISPDGQARYVHAKANLAAGLFESFTYEKECITVERGSRILVYTDGVTEAEDVNKQLFGDDRLLDFARSTPTDTSSQVFVESLFDAIKHFANGNEQNDDITIMSVKV